MPSIIELHTSVRTNQLVDVLPRAGSLAAIHVEREAAGRGSRVGYAPPHKGVIVGSIEHAAMVLGGMDLLRIWSGALVSAFVVRTPPPTTRRVESVRSSRG